MLTDNEQVFLFERHGKTMTALNKPASPVFVTNNDLAGIDCAVFSISR
jgi:hypothetical protein